MKPIKFSPNREQNQAKAHRQLTENSGNITMNGVTSDRTVDYNYQFELLSAYLDGETTPSERQQVQKWLDEDPKIQLTYRRLLKLRRGLQAMPIPASPIPAETMANQVLTQVHRRKVKQLVVWGGSAIAAALAGAVMVLSPGNNGLFPKMAETKEVKPTVAQSEELMLALSEPIVEIPVNENELMIPLDQPIVEIP